MLTLTWPVMRGASCLFLLDEPVAPDEPVIEQPLAEGGVANNA